MNETALIQRLRKGDDHAFEILIKRYQQRLFAIAYGITLDREESLEIVQDVFIAVFRGIGAFRGDASLMTWMRKMTVNICLNWKRKWARRFRWDHRSIETDAGHILPEAEEHSKTPERDYMAHESENRLMEHVADLPEKLRSVLVLNALEHLSYDEIAQLLNIKTGTVKSRLHHARKLLAESHSRG